ncbi:hypothetical protein I4U23_016199 [Adineta vaga]|nr:hypothetical protein I4U23_016199 [Adineta vaga]
MGSLCFRMRDGLINLNLFESGLTEAKILRQERWSTRIYLVLLIIAIVILVIYTAFQIETIHVTIKSPSIETFEKLQMNYANVLKCPCSQIAVKYERFTHMQPIYHQVCSSVFINDDWISSTFPTDIFNLWPMDVRRILSAHAQFLRSFCKNAQKGIDYALSSVLSASLVSAEILSRALVQLQVNIQYDSVRSAGQWHLSVLVSSLRLVMTGSRLMNGLSTNSYLTITSNDSLTANIGINIYQLNSSTSPCYCVTMDNCAMPGAIYTIPRFPTFGYYNLENLTNYSIPIQGIQSGCYPLEGVLSSTLECYYNLTFSHQRPVVICYEETSKMTKIKKKFLWLWLKIKMINLFDSESNDITKQKYERHTTRLYIFIIIIAFIALLCYTVITEETIVYTIRNPSLETYEKLYQIYSNTLQCICTKISIPYSKIITVQASYHQVCTSLFVDPTFFSQLAYIRNDMSYYSADFILLSIEYFQWLTTFCRLSQLVFYNQLLAFQTDLFINNKLLTRDTFEIQATQLADFFINDVQLYFARGIKQMREMFGITQLISATSTLTYKLPIRQTISGSQIQVLPLQLFSNCSCLSNPTSCSDNAAFYIYNSLTQSFDIDFKIEGIYIACSSMETLFQSNLACWYSSDCYQTVIKYWQNRTYSLSGLPTLLNNSTPSRFESSTSLSTIIEHLMVDNWSKNISFNSYYTECIPQYCTYSITQRRNILIVITILIGLFGGLNIVLKLSIPLIVQLGSWFITHRKGCFNLFRYNIRELPSKFVHLNLFYREQKSSELTLKKEYHSTRLYIILLFLSMLTLLFYNTFIQSTTTITILNPTQSIYEEFLQRKAISSLQCPCTHVSISYGTFLQVNTTLHEICSSSFIEQKWIESISANGDWTNLSLIDFYGRGVLYFQGLQSLCSFFQENITHYVSDFLSSTLISAQVLSEIQLMTHINDTIEYIISSSKSDKRFFFGFAKELMNSNQLMTIFSSNWIYSSIKFDPNLNGLGIPLQPISHGNCSCSISSNCTEPVTHNGEIIPGFAVGCAPINSLFQSSLICLYNQTCLNQININQIPITPLIAPLNNKYSINRTVSQLVDNVFDKQWSVDTSYTHYFKQCQPASCSYSFNPRKNFLEIIVILLGLYGGLTVALKILSPYIIAFFHWIFFRYKQVNNNNNNNVHPMDHTRY